jgi:hypothetical protein
VELHAAARQHLLLLPLQWCHHYCRHHLLQLPQVLLLPLLPCYSSWALLLQLLQETM